MMKRGDRVGLCACSNPLGKSAREKILALESMLRMFGLEPVHEEQIYGKTSAEVRARLLMQFYERNDVTAVFDLSGGDLANEILPYLDYDKIAARDVTLWGYSDLTTVINAIYAMTGKSSVLYQVRHICGRYGMWKQQQFFDSVFAGSDALFRIAYEFVQGDSMKGTVVGGNIRCLLKLAGTRYWPDMKDKILLLEARSGQEPQIRTYLAQLSQLGVFEQVSGVLLGTFTQLQQDGKEASELITDYIPDTLAVAQTDQIGHGADAQAIRIGEELSLCRSL